LKNVSSLNTPWNRKDINVSTLLVESCKWIEMLCLMRWLVGTHQWK
jgi:hypothetical protein